MSMYKSLDRVWEDIKRCYRCGYCRDMVRDLTGTFRPCPVREKLRHEHFSARGRNAIARGLVEGHLTSPTLSGIRSTHASPAMVAMMPVPSSTGPKSTLLPSLGQCGRNCITWG